jgi:exodeoxyribonuclease V gamma subunit
MTALLPPGLLILHGNRLELLQQAVFDWIRRAPLGPLDEEVFLVQSNGMAEWLKRSLAQSAGVCAATRVELPARFLWRSYRAMLGAAGAPLRSALDKAPLTWRLMRLLDSALVEQPGYEPLQGFLLAGRRGLAVRGGVADTERRLQLAQRLADLYDQYQIYRADWLDAWAAGHDHLPTAALEPTGTGLALPPDQRWQALLWRELVGELDDTERAGLRPAVHQNFVNALHQGDAPHRPLPQRVVVLGLANLPLQTLQALAALAQACQVLLAVPNPCQYHWADIIDGRELLHASRRRHGLRGGRDLSALPLEAAHAEAHPLLAAWGRQGRDFVRLLDAFDEAESTQARLQVPRIDLFDTTEPTHLLGQVQAAIRDLAPLAEHPAVGDPPAAGLGPVRAGDRSIIFHSAHSAQREVEVLHDQLLSLLAEAPVPGEPALTPRDIVVMVPDIEPFAPAIRAVFGQYGRFDARHIPFEIADLRQRGLQPVLLALEWLLRQPQRASTSELRDLLEVPALAACFGVDAADQPLLARWLAGAGVRWGLDAPHRGTLGLAACGDANTWAHGLQRMLLGYAVGDADAPGRPDTPWAGIEPYAEVGGLDAALAGSLAALLQAVRDWWRLAAEAATPAVWAERARALLAAFFKPQIEADRLLLASLDEALNRWLDACEVADFSAEVPLAVLREAWLGGVDEPGLNERFLGGGVTFCTLMPMRAIPFQVVCLLGMNDGDYPRRGIRSDFDLMALPGQRRPGDRARRDDDRYLMLEALLAARRQLYISWSGRSPRDQSLQPPSVLVAQLRDYLAAGWGAELPARLTTEHPLQAFSRRYFEPDAAANGLVTYAREWRAAHRDEPALADPVDPPAGNERPGAVSLQTAVTAVADGTLIPVDRSANAADDNGTPVAAGEPANPPLTLALLTEFLRSPVRSHFRHQLGVVFDRSEQLLNDDEPFVVGGLEESGLLSRLIHDPAVPGGGLALAADRLQRSGLLPLAGPGQRTRAALLAQVEPMLRAWQLEQQSHARPWPRQPLRFEPAGSDGLRLDDWLDELQCADADGQPVWLHLSATRLAMKPKPNRSATEDAAELVAQPDKLVPAWVRCLSAAACGVPLQAVLVGRDALLHLPAPEPAEARAALRDLLAAWQAGKQAPLPVACRSALSWLAQADSVEADSRAAQVYEGDSRRTVGERDQDPCLQRAFADFEALSHAPWSDDADAIDSAAPHAFGRWAERLYAPLRAWAQQALVQPLPDAAEDDGADGSDDDD